MPSRLIISSVNRNTPVRAATPARSVDVCRWPSISPLICRPGPPHVHRERQHRHGRHERQRPFEPLLVGGVEEQVATDAAHRHGDDDAPVHGLGQLAASALAQVREADGDDQEGFESFAEGDDERLQHDARTPYPENETQSQNLNVSLLPPNPTGQVSNRVCDKLGTMTARSRRLLARRPGVQRSVDAGDVGSSSRRSARARRSCRSSRPSPTPRSGSCPTCSRAISRSSTTRSRSRWSSSRTRFSPSPSS